mgnify:CR=1 FL=1
MAATQVALLLLSSILAHTDQHFEVLSIRETERPIGRIGHKIAQAWSLPP